MFTFSTSYSLRSSLLKNNVRKKITSYGSNMMMRRRIHIVNVSNPMPFVVMMRNSKFIFNKRSLSNSTMNSKDETSFSSSTPSPLFEVANIDKYGNTSFCSLTVIEILQRFKSMHVRDLFSLNLTSTLRYEASVGTSRKNRRTPCVILPRENDIIMSFGYIRALIGPESAIIFDAHEPSVKMLVEELSDMLQRRSKIRFSEKEEENIAYGIIKSPENESFEILFVEEILRDVSDTYARRLKLYEPILKSTLSRVTNEMFAATAVHRLIPVKDSIQEFEIHVKAALECLTTMLANDEDMLGLLLTEKRNAIKDGVELDLKQHERVELLVEEYTRRLSSILQDSNYFLKKVESKQELVAVSLDAYRNRMIRMDVYLSIGGLGIASATAIAGFYGMNLINGLETSPTAFGTIILSALASGVLIGVGGLSYISGHSMKMKTLGTVKELEVIDGALSHLNAIDYAMKSIVNRKMPLDRNEFEQRITECQPSSIIKDEETDYLFNAFDVSRDGMIFEDDFQSFSSSGLASRNTGNSHSTLQSSTIIKD